MMAGDDSADQKPAAAVAAGAKPSPPGRLSSIRRPRDLNLTSGLRPAALLAARGTRKVFVPNLDAQRYKPKPEAKSERGRGSGRGSRDGSGVRNGKGSRGDGSSDRGRGRGEGRFDKKRENQFIQMAGTAFSEGIAAAVKPRIATDSASGGGEKNSSAMMMPVFTGNKRVDKEEEERKLAALLKDDFVDDLRELCDESMAPVCLPLTASFTADTQSTKSSLKVKNEPESDDEDKKDTLASIDQKLAMPDDDKKPLPGGPAGAHYRAPFSRRPPLSSLFTKPQQHEQLIFLQMPDSLPALIADSVASTANHNAPTSASTNHSASTAASSAERGDVNSETSGGGDRVAVCDLPEGQIGRLQIHKSGAVRLRLGQHSLLLEPATNVKFLQELASVSVDESGDSAELCILGEVQHRVVCSPDWEALVGS